MSKECTTHHHACDCREEKFKQLEQENAALQDAIEESEEFARKNGEACGSKIRELLRENAALREDKERLDWLESGCSCDLSWVGKEAPPSALTSLRNAIDWTRKEAQR